MLSDAPFEVPPYLLEKADGVAQIPMAIAGADNEIALESARQATEAGLIKPVLVGDGDIIRSLADVIDWDVRYFDIIEAGTEEEACEKSVALAAEGRVKALMKGHVHSDVLMRAVLKKDAGLRTKRRISHVFHMTIPGRERVLLITDGAVNVAPNVETKMDIVRNAVDLSKMLGTATPKVAMLSGTETVNASMPSTIDAEEVVRRASEGEITGCIIDGPFAFDNALSPDAAKLKGISGPVAGNADIVVVPNIETGNGLFKMMVYFMSGLAASIVLGAKVPIVLTSRADPPEARFAASILAAVVANESVRRGA